MLSGVQLHYCRYSLAKTLTFGRNLIFRMADESPALASNLARCLQRLPFLSDNFAIKLLKLVTAEAAVFC